jgi:type IV fimbrial biogenesis protein FimT
MHEPTRHPLSNETGFTLIELIVTISIVGVLAALAIPSFTSTITSNRLTTATNQVVSALNLARSEAVKHGTTVIVTELNTNACTNPSATAQWEGGWDVYIDINGNGSCDSKELIKSFPLLQSGYTLRSTNFTPSISYTQLGQNASGAGNFTICNTAASSLAFNSKLIQVKATGQAHIALDSNNDGIPNTDTVTTAASNITSCTN